MIQSLLKNKERSIFDRCSKILLFLLVQLLKPSRYLQFRLYLIFVGDAWTPDLAKSLRMIELLRKKGYKIRVKIVPLNKSVSENQNEKIQELVQLEVLKGQRRQSRYCGKKKILRRLVSPRRKKLCPCDTRMSCRPYFNLP